MLLTSASGRSVLTVAEVTLGAKMYARRMGLGRINSRTAHKY